MSRDRSLEEFVGATDPVSDDETREEDSAGETREVEPIEPTYGWSPGGAVCDSCGSTVESRWLEDGTRVCVDCKAW